MLLLHAILPTDAAAPPEAGLRGWPVCEIHAGELAAWATRCEQFAPGQQDLLAQHALLEEALGACLPVRFPTWLDSDLAVRELLVQRQEALLGALERVRGRVELAVTLTWSTPVVPNNSVTTGSSPGKRYLQARRRHYAQSDQRRTQAQGLKRLIEAVDGVVEAQHHLTNLGLSSAVLVRADDALAVAERLRDLPECVRILVNGPWPPYSFVSLEG